ncbi:hypothetical protein ACSUEI_26395, partial [Serratia marcescens]
MASGTELRLCRMAAAPYPAYGAALVVGLISEAPSGNRTQKCLKRLKMNAIRVENVSKTFVLHQQNGVRLPVLK